MSHVTPGGRVLKLTLTKRGPLKITTEAQKKPDPSQTTVKTVYGPTKEKEPLQGSKSIKGETTYIERENFENQRIKPKEAPNGKKDESFPEGGAQLDKSNQVVMVVLMEMGDQIKAKNHPERGKDHQKDLEKWMGVEEDQILVMMMGMEVDLTLPHQKTLHQQEEGIGGPSLSMYCRDLLGHQVKWDNTPTGQAGRDRRDGQTPQLTKALEDALKTQKTSWDTTNLENSFDYFGRTMHEVLKAQQRTTQNLEEQFKRANET